MSEPEGTQTPIEVIEDIRSGDYLLDVEGESAKVKRGARSLQEKLNRTLKLLSEDLYSKQTHFVLELIQNADDNDYAPRVAPQLTFRLSPERMVLVNNEVGFAEKHVRALCDVGKSSKTKKAGYIGEKGIGFKSVFTVSSAPEIHSNGYHFRFDRSNEADLLGYVVPVWCGDVDEAQGNATTIILPAKAGFEFSPDTVEDLDSRLLLFLSKVRELRLEHADTQVTYRRRDINGLSHLSTHREGAGATELVEEVRFVRVSVPFRMGDVPDEKRPEFDTSTVVLAFSVDANGAADPQPASQVFAFLPIRQFGFKFAVQADFILSSGREDIHTDRPWNKRLRDAISVAFQHSVEQFKKSDALAFSYLKFIPTDSEVLNPFFKPVAAQTIHLLRDTPCLPSASGAWKVPRELRYGGKRFRELFTPEVAIELFGFDYVDARVQADDELLKKLGAQPITYLDYVNVFKLKGDWFKGQPLEWKAKFYGFLSELDPQTLVKNGLAGTPCVPTIAGDLAVPNTTSVFYPLSRGKKYGFESELTIVDSELLDAATTHSPRVSDLFAALKVKPDDPYDLITSHILPRHKKGWKDSEHKALVGHIRYTKDKLSQYLTGAVLAGKTEAQALAAIREGVWVGTKQNHDGTWFFNRATSLYFGKEYKPQFCIETLLGEGIEDAGLVSAEYLASRVKDADAEAESWRAFLGQIGVRVTPKLAVMDDGDWQCSPELQRLLESQQSSVRRATLECLDRHWFEYAEHLSYAAKVGRSLSVQDTLFAKALRSMNAPTRKRATTPIAQSYYPTAELKELFGDRPAYVDAVLKSTGLLDACRVTYRVDARACIKRLQQLKAEGWDTTPQLHAIYRNLERFWGKESAFIERAFAQESLIRVKGTHAIWAQRDEVTWRSNSQFLDGLFPPLQGQYRDFSAFFNDRLGIPKELPTEKWVQALSRLGEIASPEERVREAIAIYRRANRDLTPKFGRDEAPSPAWLEVFESDEVFLNQRGELVANGASLFANDSPELAILFGDDEDISLLAIPFEDVPRVGRLLQAAQVQLLSTSVEVEVVEASGGHVRGELTTRVRQVLPFVARIFYAKDHDRFEAAVAGGLFERLRDIEVVEVPELKREVTLAGVTRETTADVATSADRILLRAGARSVTNQIATELCRFLGASEDLADTVSVVLMAADAESIEDFLRVRRVAPLPADIQASMTGEVWAQPARNESEGATQDTPSATGSDEAEGGVVESGSNSPEIEVQAELGEDVGSHRVEAHVGDSPGGLTGSGGQADSLRGSEPLGTPGDAPRAHQAPLDPEPAERPRGTQTPRVPAGDARTGPRAPKEVVPGEAAPDANTGDASPKESAGEEPTTQPPMTMPPRIGEFGKSPGGTSSSRHQRTRGRTLQTRTKTGRLLSYAASPDEAQRERGADTLEKAAARDATGQAAVDYFLATQSERWKLLTPMPHNNPGFDVKAVALDGNEEFIEVKGQSGAWTEEGVALTPTELMAAQRGGERYWLCVVEYAHDENRRALHLVKNPFGLTDQFRFDSGWRSVAISETAIPLKPEAGVVIEIPGDGRGRILSSRKKGQFFKLHVILDGGGPVHRTYNPATMKLFAD